MRFIPQYEPIIEKDYADCVHDQIMSGWLGPGQAVSAFENKICEITGTKYAIATTSGTTALYVSILATTKKDEHIYFPDYTFIAGANAARICDRRVELIDIKENTLCMDPEILSDNLKHRRGCPGGVIFVNHNGYVDSDRYDIKEICIGYGITMIEDSSQSLGIWDCSGLHAGRLGDVGIFSFSVPKLVTTGQGGCIITDNENIAIECRRLIDQGGEWRKTKVHECVGGNFKFNDILASYGLAQLERIDDLLQRREQIFDWYREHISIVDFGYESTWMVLYRTKKAKEIIDKLKENNIQATQFYNPIHKNPPYIVEDPIFPCATKVSKEIVYLPSSLNLTKEEINLICDIIKSIE